MGYKGANITIFEGDVLIDNAMIVKDDMRTTFQRFDAEPAI